MVKDRSPSPTLVVFHSGGYGFAPYTPCTGKLWYENHGGMHIGALYIPNSTGTDVTAGFTQGYRHTGRPTPDLSI